MPLYRRRYLNKKNNKTKNKTKHKHSPADWQCRQSNSFVEIVFGVLLGRLKKIKTLRYKQENMGNEWILHIASLRGDIMRKEYTDADRTQLDMRREPGRTQGWGGGVNRTSCYTAPAEVGVVIKNLKSPMYTQWRERALTLKARAPVCTYVRVSCVCVCVPNRIEKDEDERKALSTK